MKLTELSNKQTLVSPSILAADFARLGDDVRTIASADMVHLDVMDGHFVPNLSIGVPVIKSLREDSDMFFDAHLMITDPDKYVEIFAKAGCEHITVHVEAEGDPNSWIKKIKDSGCTAGLSVKPKTPAEAVFPYLDQIEMVLVMTVEPGFGGQSFMEDQMEKISAIRAEIERRGLNVHIQVDGGINASTAQTTINAGANILVAGTAIFKHPQGADFAVKELQAITAE